jgi:hypothetical protein
MRKEPQLQIDLNDDRRQKQNAKMNPAGWIAQMRGVGVLLLLYRV